MQKSQIFLNISYHAQENGSWGTHFAKSLNSNFLKGLTSLRTHPGTASPKADHPDQGVPPPLLLHGQRPTTITLARVRSLLVSAKHVVEDTALVWDVALAHSPCVYNARWPRSWTLLTLSVANDFQHCFPQNWTLAWAWEGCFITTRRSWWLF